MPAHAQLMSSLLAADRAVYCRGERRADGSGWVRCALDWGASSMYTCPGTIAVHTQRAVWKARECRSGGRAQRGAHVKHVVHGRVAGGVPAQRLVEGERELPRVASRAHVVRGGLRAGRRDARQASAACTQPQRGEGAIAGWRAGRGEQRTVNISRMSVTREVSQLEMSGLKACAPCAEGRKQGTHGAGRTAGREAGGGE